MAEHDHHPAAGVKAGLQRKLGPLPVWAWASIGGIGLGYLLYRRRAASSTTTTAAAAPGTDSGAPQGDLLGGVGNSGSGGGIGSPGGLDPGVTGDTTTPGVQGAGYPDIGTEIQDVLGLVDALQPLGLLNGAGGGVTGPGGQATDGPSTATATAHPAAAKSMVKVNAQAGNPRAGQPYKTVKLANGRTAHVYGTGNAAKTIVLPGTTSVAGTSHRAPVAHAAAPAAEKVNTQAGSARQGETYRTLTSGGWIVHRYGSGKNYTDVKIRKA